MSVIYSTVCIRL